MPGIVIDSERLAKFGEAWRQNGSRLSRSPPYSSIDLGRFFDTSIAEALSVMLGGIPVLAPNAQSLLPVEPDCVELGTFRVVGGIRAQNFDVGYRPDGVRIAFDSKTLNDSKSVGKNYQNMINDLATEAATVHSRFPYAVVTFLVAIPEPCIGPSQRAGIVSSLERLSGRKSIGDENHRAEVIGLACWDPETGRLDPDTPLAGSALRVDEFSSQLEEAYWNRYKGLPPHLSRRRFL